MAIKKLILVSAISGFLTACGGGGDVNISPSNVDNSVDNSTTTDGGASLNGVCARYTKDGVVFEGTLEAGNCTYSRDFVDITNPLTVDVTFPSIGTGLHIFDGSLVVGQSFSNDADLASAGIVQGGSPSDYAAKITIQAGNTFVFKTTEDYAVINRGSQIFAEGTAAAPITFTSYSDAVSGTVAFDDVQQWGGMIINGFGVTNKCKYTGDRGVDLAKDLAAAPTGCHVAAEGKSGSAQTYYGGDNDADNSGVLSYFIVKHTGAEVSPGNELNGIAFGGVGSATQVNNLQVFSTYDDGIEMFGGAVDVTNFVALYVRDDSFDVDEGYIGTLENALIIQAANDGQQCIESDGIGSYKDTETARNADFIARGLNSAATVNNMTCIVSGNQAGTHGDSVGVRIREGHAITINDSIITSALTNNDGLDECLRIDNAETRAAGFVTITNTLLACEKPFKDADTVQIGGVAIATWYSAADADNVIEATDGAQTITALNGYFSTGTRGAVAADDDWTAGWTVGLDSDDLWVQPAP